MHHHPGTPSSSIRDAQPHGARRRLLAGAATSAVSAAALLGVFAPAAHATQEFPPNPAATIGTSCTVWTGGSATITYTNVGGLSAATFSPVIGGVAKADVVVAPNGTATDTEPLSDGQTIPVQITAAGMAAIDTVLGPVDCYDGTSMLHVDCVNGAPVLTGVSTNTGQSMLTAIFVVNGNVGQSSQASVAPGTSYTFTAPLPDNAAYTADLSFASNQGVNQSLAGSAACTPPTTTTVPPTTEPPTTTTQPAPTTTVPETTTSVAQLSPSIPSAPTTSPAVVALPTTGAHSSTVAWLAAAFTAAGAAAIRIVRRPLRRS